MSYYFLILPIIICTVIGQLLVKHGISLLGKVSFSIKGILFFLIKAFTNLYIFSGLILSIIATCIWFIVLTKIPLSRAYPFMALTFAFVVILSAYIFKETTSWLSWVGLTLICLGIILITR